jgi:hypothetical protein
MSRRRAVIAMLAVSAAALTACNSSYDRSPDGYDGGSSAAAATAARVQTGNLPSG